MTEAQARRRAESLKGKLENAYEYGRSYAFALTDHDKPHQEHFRLNAIAWTEELLKELRR